jgi:hypothetical protein
MHPRSRFDRRSYEAIAAPARLADSVVDALLAPARARLAELLQSPGHSPRRRCDKSASCSSTSSVPPRSRSTSIPRRSAP